jgi:hypothetical protein
MFIIFFKKYIFESENKSKVKKRKKHIIFGSIRIQSNMLNQRLRLLLLQTN